MSEDPAALAAHVVRGCREASVTLATAESVTAGLVASTLADVPGCSAVLRGGVIAYATQAKHSVLGLPEQVLQHVVSEEVARRMAISVTALLDATIGVATTGVAGPDWLDEQPPGSAWIAVHDRRGGGRTVAEHVRVKGSRAQVRSAIVEASLGLVLRSISE